MKLTGISKQLILFFIKNKHMYEIKQTSKTKAIFSELYNDIYSSYKYIENLQNSQKQPFYTIQSKKITHSYQITKPKNFNTDSFPSLIYNHINEQTTFELSYTFVLDERKITILFMLEKDLQTEIQIKTFTKYVNSILMWLLILNKHASKKCSTSLTIYLYFTSLKKHLPKTKDFVLDQVNVNTAFTQTCPINAEIVIFRKEEWFKVFIHETFHTFGLDFSDMDDREINKCILNIFKVNSKLNIYEGYTEFWAKTINVLFCSFFLLKNKTDIDIFLYNTEIFINYEITFSLFQLIKILDFMGLSYKDLYSDTKQSKINREKYYKENTNVLSYYIISTILLNNYQEFLIWTKTHNILSNHSSSHSSNHSSSHSSSHLSSLFQFKKTFVNQKEFCNFIERHYKNTKMLDTIDTTYIFINKMNERKKTNNNTLNNKYILSNLRMTICELG